MRAGRLKAGRFLRRFARHRLAVASALLLLVLAVAAVAAPWVEHWLGVEATGISLLDRFGPPDRKSVV